MKKIKRNLFWIVVTTLMTLIPLFIGLIMWNKLPDTMATHFNFRGEADGYSSKAFAVVGLNLFLTIVHVVVALLTAVDPKNEDDAISDKIYCLILLIIPVTSVFCGVLTYSDTIGITVNVPLVTQLFIGLLFLVLGNYMPKMHRNYTVGVRLPWTMDDTENWDHTNRFAGRLFMVCGLIMIMNAFLNVGGEKGLVFILIGCAIIEAVIPAIYSYIYYIRHKK